MIILGHYLLIIWVVYIFSQTHIVRFYYTIYITEYKYT